MKYILPVLIISATLVRDAQALAEFPEKPQVQKAIKHLLRSSKQHVLNRNEQGLNRFSEAILQASSRSQLPWEVIMGISYCESTFRTKARGKLGEIGLMQLHGKSWAYCKEKEDRKIDKTSVEDQLICGGHWFSHAMSKCDESVEQGLSMYLTGDVCKPKKGGNLNFLVKSRMKVIQSIRNIRND